MEVTEYMLGLYATIHSQVLAVTAMELSSGQSHTFSVKSRSSSIYSEGELQSSNSTIGSQMHSQVHLWYEFSGASDGDVQVLLDISATQHQQAIATLNSNENRHSSKSDSVKNVSDYYSKIREGAEGPRCITAESRQLSCNTEHNVTLKMPRIYVQPMLLNNGASILGNKPENDDLQHKAPCEEANTREAISRSTSFWHEHEQPTSQLCKTLLPSLSSALNLERFESPASNHRIHQDAALQALDEPDESPNQSKDVVVDRSPHATRSHSREGGHKGDLI